MKNFLTLLLKNQKQLLKNKSTIQKQLEKEDLSQSEYEERLDEELSQIDISKSKVYKLSPDEEIALKQIDMMKEEISTIVSV